MIESHLRGIISELGSDSSNSTFILYSIKNTISAAGTQRRCNPSYHVHYLIQAAIDTTLFFVDMKISGSINDNNNNNNDYKLLCIKQKINTRILF